MTIPLSVLFVLSLTIEENICPFFNCCCVCLDCSTPNKLLFLTSFPKSLIKLFYVLNSEALSPINLFVSSADEFIKPMVFV